MLFLLRSCCVVVAFCACGAGLPLEACAGVEQPSSGAGLSLAAHLAFVLLELALLAAVGGLVLRLRRQGRDAAGAYETAALRLSRIADNLDGGFLSLRAQEPLTILDASRGFWNMLGYADASRPQDLAALLERSDLSLLLHRITTATPPAAIQADLRLRQSDGRWLPLRLRGSLPPATADQPPILDCVVQNLADQRHMREELEEEKERYRLILEQSQDIIVDVDVEKRRCQCSTNFHRKFGERAAPAFDDAGRLSFGQAIHQEDSAAFQEIQRRILAGDPSAFAVVRMRTAEGRYIWCRIHVTRISKPGAPLRLVGKIMDIDESVRQRAQLERLSQRDSLTDLLNKTAFNEKVSSSLPARLVNDRTDALIFLDLDNFKTLNDTLGHVKGDEALIRAAGIIRSVFRNADAVGRFGGDEFCVFVRGITREALRERAEALRSGLHMFFDDQDGHTVEVTSSIGIYPFDGSEPSYDVALQRADTAQYHAKQSGKNGFRFYDEVEDGWTESFPHGGDPARAQ